LGVFAEQVSELPALEARHWDKLLDVNFVMRYQYRLGRNSSEGSKKPGNYRALYLDLASWADTAVDGQKQPKSAAVV
jgi:hypothetical protein